MSLSSVVAVLNEWKNFQRSVDCRVLWSDCANILELAVFNWAGDFCTIKRSWLSAVLFWTRLIYYPSHMSECYHQYSNGQCACIETGKRFSCHSSHPQASAKLQFWVPLDVSALVLGDMLTFSNLRFTTMTGGLFDNKSITSYFDIGAEWVKYLQDCWKEFLHFLIVLFSVVYCPVWIFNRW